MQQENLEEITVSILCVCYNHENYIRACLDSFIMQKCNFKYEVIIHDDASTDNSANIIREYETKYPHIIKPIYQTENKFSTDENIWLDYMFPKIKGKYIAMCDGDDYWTDPLKLQKQIDFLEANKDYVLCFHKVNILTEEGIKEDFITSIPENYEERKTLVQEDNYIHTPSVVFRNILQDEYKTLEFRNTPIGDYFLYLMLTKYGKMGFLPETMAIYRFGVGIFSNVSKYKQAKMNILLYSNLYAIEKDEAVKTIFYEKLKNLIDYLVKEANSSALLETRRHKIVENLYKKIKRK